MNGEPNVFPAPRYEDGPGVIDWPKRAFCFEKHMVVEGPDDTIAHAKLQPGGEIVMMGWTARNPDLDQPWDKMRFSVYVCVGDIDAHYARAKAAGAEISRAPGDTGFGSREYGTRDPEGNPSFFGTCRPLVS